MESGCGKCDENIYKECRKEAAIYNDALNSRERAANLLGISPSTLANHELGLTKVVPVDTVVMMAETYNAPHLKNHYCKNECPIGRCKPIPTEIKTLESVTIALLNSLDKDEVQNIKKTLVQISSDGKVNPEEEEEFIQILKAVDKIVEDMGSLKLLGEKILKGKRW